MMTRALLMLAALVTGTLGNAAEEGSPTGSEVVEDWPHFLGPNCNATTTDGPLQKVWPEGGPKIVWEEACGDGYACPVIADGRLFYFHRVDGKETVDCREPSTGELLWRFDYPVEYVDRYGFSAGPRSSVVVSEGLVYVAGVTARLHCLSADQGKLIWEKDLAEEYRVPQYFFGYGPTPLVHGGSLIVNVGGRSEDESGTGVCVAAFDKKTGKTLWEVEDSWGASYASPVAATIRGKSCALVLAGGESRPAEGGLLTIDAGTGEVYDRFPWRADKYESVLASSALAIDDRRVFISECYELGGVLLEFDEAIKAKPLWTQREFGMHFMMPIEKDACLFGFAGRNPPDTEFKCVDLETGEILWSKDYRWEREGKIEGLFRGSLLQAGERFFALGEDGIFIELELSRENSKELQRCRFFTAREAWTLPSLHDGRLYVVQNTSDAETGRGPRMICYDLRGELEVQE